MKGFKISSAVRAKLLASDHNVIMDEVVECFMNRNGPSFKDSRAEHDTDPMTQWFVAETDKGRVLKILYVEHPEFFAIKSAYEANEKWRKLYIEMCNSNNTP